MTCISSSMWFYFGKFRRHNPSFQEYDQRGNVGGLQGLAIHGQSGLSQDDLNHILLLLPAADEAEAVAFEKQRVRSTGAQAKHEGRHSPSAHLNEKQTPPGKPCWHHMLLRRF